VKSAVGQGGAARHAAAWTSTTSSSARAGGSDYDLDRLVALCRSCHDQTDAPLAAGRLIVTPLGDGQFRFDVVHGPAKYRWPGAGHDRPLHRQPCLTGGLALKRTLKSSRRQTLGRAKSDGVVGRLTSKQVQDAALITSSLR